jgi:hypothetical protein
MDALFQGQCPTAKAKQMTREQLRMWLLTHEGMGFFRKAIIEHYSWLIHETGWDTVNGIRRNGLQPKNPDPNRPIPNEVLGEQVVCLNPVGSLPARSSKSGKLFYVGLRATDLPQRLGLDWSFPESWNLRKLTEAQIENFGTDGAVLYTVDGTGSIVSYDPVHASLLRVCTVGKHGNFPCTWPMLAAVGDNQIFTREGDV